MKNLYAYTAPATNAEIYPEYISINEAGEGKISITIRSKYKFDNDKGHAVEGSQAYIELSGEQFNQMLAALATKGV